MNYSNFRVLYNICSIPSQCCISSYFYYCTQIYGLEKSLKRETVVCDLIVNAIKAQAFCSKKYSGVFSTDEYYYNFFPHVVGVVFVWDPNWYCTISKKMTLFNILTFKHFHIGIVDVLSYFVNPPLSVILYVLWNKWPCNFAVHVTYNFLAQIYRFGWDLGVLEYTTLDSCSFSYIFCQKNILLHGILSISKIAKQWFFLCSKFWRENIYVSALAIFSPQYIIHSDYHVCFQANRNKIWILSQGGNENMWAYYCFHVYCCNFMINPPVV